MPDDFYTQVYSQDFPVDNRPHGWIQWKGTKVCIDLHCECGHHGHFDGDFFYAYECKCGKKYMVGANVALIALTPEQIAHQEKRATGFKKEDPTRIDA